MNDDRRGRLSRRGVDDWIWKITTKPGMGRDESRCEFFVCSASDAPGSLVSEIQRACSAYTLGNICSALLVSGGGVSGDFADGVRDIVMAIARGFGEGDSGRGVLFAVYGRHRDAAFGIQRGGGA